MQPLVERLQSGEVLVADGAMGTMLLESGLQPGECPESVNLSRPKTIAEIAGRYLEAGADILETNTFGASPMKLSQHGLESRMAEINENAVHTVRQVTGDRAYVAASCGPCGRLLQPHGDADPEEVYDSFLAQLTCLIGAGVDCVCVETMTDLAEARLAVRAAKAVSPATPVMASMTFDATPKGFFTIMGVSIEQAAAGLHQAGAEVVGSNCGNGIESMVEIARGFRKCGTLPIIIQANAGLPLTPAVQGRPEMRNGVPVYGETPAFVADKARELVAVGVSVIGGCCGTTPDHTRAIRAMVDSLANH